MFFDVDEICGFPQDDDIAEAAGRGQNDPKPEYFQYRDEGCKRAKSCLDCPFAQCFYDRPKPPRPNRRRDMDIKTLRRSGKTIKQLSRRFKVSKRTIERVLKKPKSRDIGEKSEKGDKNNE